VGDSPGKENERGVLIDQKVNEGIELNDLMSDGGTWPQER